MALFDRKFENFEHKEEAEKRCVVHPVCQKLWKDGLAAHREDSFIGLVCTVGWTIYLAPCFATPPGGAAKSTGHASSNTVGAEFGGVSVSTHVPKGPQFVYARHTAAQEAVHLKVRLADLLKVYGPHGVCLVEMPQEDAEQTKFDGLSHQALSRWIMNHPVVKNGYKWACWNTALGIAIQKEGDHYGIRYASTLNQSPGQVKMGGTRTFSMRDDETKQQGREVRDLPQQWAEFIRGVIIRDLDGELLPTESGKRFDRIISRGVSDKSKISRFRPRRSQL